MGGEIEVGLIQVAHGHDLGVRMDEERVENLVTAVAQADEAQANPVVRAEDAAAAHRGADPGRGRRLAELPACEGGHDYLLVLIELGGASGAPPRIRGATLARRILHAGSTLVSLRSTSRPPRPPARYGEVNSPSLAGGG